VPHQICQFHALHEASRPIYELDHSIRTQIRKQVQKKLWAFRVTIEQRLQQARDGEARQLAILQDYAAAIQAAIHVDGLAPFEYAGLKMDEALTHIQQSLQRLQKKGQQ